MEEHSQSILITYVSITNHQSRHPSLHLLKSLDILS